MESEGMKQMNGEVNDVQHTVNGAYLQTFSLYKTYSKFYAIGWNMNRTVWKVLKIDRSDNSELEVYEDPTIYSEDECSDLLRRIKAGNKSVGGLKFVTTFYGIIGFIKFLGPHYMLLITETKEVGFICGHTIYTITQSEMIPISNSYGEFNMHSSKSENRYKKLFGMMDLTKDFYFSYSYNLMLSFQKNISNHEVQSPIYETLYVWNEFLSRGFRNQLNNATWTVALVYGFFKQVKLSESGRDFWLTLIARRSRHYAGTRYLKRGINDKGFVANDVETEQIVYEDVSDGHPTQISSVVQIRGSVPLFWSQETPVLNIRPDIKLSRNDQSYAATKLHFDNLVYRYGNPIIILDLVKGHEKKPRESILLAEFVHAIYVINRDLAEKDHLKFIHWDLSRHSKKKDKNPLDSLTEVVANVLDMTGSFFCHTIQSSRTEECLNVSHHHRHNGDGDPTEGIPNRDSDKRVGKNGNVVGLDITRYCKPLMFQNGVLRTNCIDCLDRTNVAQYCYGLVALGRQLYNISFIGTPNIDSRSPLADDLMKLYEAMGDILAFQYGGSAAHNKILAARRGQPKGLTLLVDSFRTVHRYYSNAFMDAKKQDTINVFLGHFRPQHDRPALWELDADQHFNVGRHDLGYVAKSSRSTITRSFSDGNIPSDPYFEQNEDSYLPNSSYTPSVNRIRDDTSSDESEKINCSKFFDVDWRSSSSNEAYERSALKTLSSTGHSTNTVASSMKDEGACSDCHPLWKVKDNVLTEFSERFVHWVEHEELFFLYNF